MHDVIQSVDEDLKEGIGRPGLLASIRVLTSISIIIPTYREVENIPHILRRLDDFRRSSDVNIEVLFMDDDSGDGSVAAVEKCGFDWAKIVVRTEDRGLSRAVIDGFRRARFPVLVCMDCDLSHPPEIIPQMVLALSSGQQFILGSRYVPGGTTDDDWGFFRWLNSRVATWMSRPLTSARDPMSGFFAMRKSDFDSAKELNPVGYKVALELIVKCGFLNVGEIPIRFTDRIYGQSKLTLKQQLLFLQHLRRLYIHKFANAMHLLQFLFVGLSGLIVNLAVVTLMQAMGVSEIACLATGIAVSVVSNFLLNRRFTFSYARHKNIWKQFAGFVGASIVGIVVNYAVAIYVSSSLLAGWPYSLQMAAMIGVASGTIFNFISNRYIVFRKTFIRK